MRELTDQQIDRILTAGLGEEAEQLAQPRATSAEMTVRVRQATRRRTVRRPLMLMAAALLIAGSVAAWIGTRPNLNSEGGTVNCVSTLPDGWRLRLNLALPGAKPDIVTLDRDGLLVRGSDISGYEAVSSWASQSRSWARQLEPQEADAMVAAVDDAFPEGFCGTIASDPTQATSPSIESAGSRFVMVNGPAMQRARVSSTEEMRDYGRLISILREIVIVPPAELQHLEPDSFDLMVATSRGRAVGPDAAAVRLPEGQNLSTVGSPVEVLNRNDDPLQAQIPNLAETRCLTIPSEDAADWAAALDASGAWSSDNGAWLFANDPEMQTLVRLVERRPFQPECTKPLWPQANAEDSVTSPMNAVDPCGLISPEEMLSTFGRRSTGEIAPWYFPDAEGCVYRFDAANRAPPVVGIRLSETTPDEFQRLAEFYLGTEGLTSGRTASGYEVFYNGCESSTTPARCAAVVASEPHLAIVYVPLTRADETDAPGVLRALVEAVTFPED